MHEIGIANAILEAVQSEMVRHSGALPRKIVLRIGELAALDPDSLRFCFEVLTRDTDLASLELEIELCRRRHRCPVCSAEFTVADHDCRCPQCGQEKTEFISGDQLELAYIEVEEHEPDTA